MKSYRFSNELAPLIALCAAFVLLLVPGKSRAADPIVEGFFSPELLMKTHDQIGLTEDQGAALKAAFEDAQQRTQGLQQQMQEETKKLADLAKPDRVDEKAVTVQADKILDIEREIRHAQLSLMVVIKNTLTTEQQAKLRELKGSVAGLETKMDTVKQAVQRWQQEGRDLAPLASLKTEIESLMAQGKTDEVSAVLDRALKILNDAK